MHAKFRGFCPTSCKLKCSRQVLVKPPKTKFRPLGTDMVHTRSGRQRASGQTDRWTGVTKLRVALRTPQGYSTVQIGEKDNCFM